MSEKTSNQKRIYWGVIRVRDLFGPYKLAKGYLFHEKKRALSAINSLEKSEDSDRREWDIISVHMGDTTNVFLRVVWCHWISRYGWSDGRQTRWRNELDNYGPFKINGAKGFSSLTEMAESIRENKLPDAVFGYMVFRMVRKGEWPLD